MNKSINLGAPPPLRADINATLTSAQDLVYWILERLDSIDIGNKQSAKISGSLLDLCLEHHVGIVHLLAMRINGSAFALIRPQFEALVRGLWLFTCASEKQIQSILVDDCFPLTPEKMISAVEERNGFGSKLLSRIKEVAYIAMNGYTHGGVHQITRRIKELSIEPNYAPEDIIEALKLSGTLALTALYQIAQIANDDRLMADVTMKLNR